MFLNHFVPISAKILTLPCFSLSDDQSHKARVQRRVLLLTGRRLRLWEHGDAEDWAVGAAGFAHHALHPASGRVCQANSRLLRAHTGRPIDTHQVGLFWGVASPHLQDGGLCRKYSHLRWWLLSQSKATWTNVWRKCAGRSAESRQANWMRRSIWAFTEATHH